jgi:hypothetical protein
MAEKTSKELLERVTEFIEEDRELIKEHLEALNSFKNGEQYSLKEESNILAKLLTSLQTSSIHMLRVVEVMNKIAPDSNDTAPVEEATTGLSFTELINKKQKEAAARKEN